MGAGHARYINSFPTRRSSDLEQALAELNVIQAEITREVAKTDTGVDLKAAIIPLESEVVGAARHGMILLDRKSTRLNSSHLGSSYPGFCLKPERSWGSARRTG